MQCQLLQAAARWSACVSTSSYGGMYHASSCLRPFNALTSSISTSAPSTSGSDAAKPSKTKEELNAAKLERKLDRRKARKEYLDARSAWRRQVHALKQQWLQEHQRREAAEAAALAKQRLAAATASGQVQAGNSEVQRLQSLHEELRKAHLEFEVAQLRLARAETVRAQQQVLTQAEELRRRQLLEASRTWIGTKAELTARINQALDNPQPFGFIVNIPKEQGLGAPAPRAAAEQAPAAAAAAPAAVSA